jgi:hypothetical protein
MLGHKYNMEVLQAGNAAKAGQLCQSKLPDLVRIRLSNASCLATSFSGALDV